MTGQAGDLVNSDSRRRDPRVQAAADCIVGRLVVISGLPGVGKTSVAQAFAVSSGAVHLSIDDIEEAILSCGLQAGWQVGVAAYESARAMAERNLALGRDVVVDAVNDSDEARRTWRTATARTGARLDFVHLVLSDPTEHKRRLDGRDRGLAHVGEPTWADVERRRASYANWSDEVLEFDTATSAAPEIADALIGVQDSTSQCLRGDR